jgi:hypothetical protein
MEVVKPFVYTAGRIDVLSVAEGRSLGDPAFLWADVSLLNNLAGFGSEY